MNYWLVKSEPSVYSYERLEKEGKAVWDGVRNFAARKHLRGMKVGDQELFYHSNEGLAVGGIAKVLKETHQGPTTKDDWSAVDLAPYKKLKNPVPLTEMKKEKKLQNIGLIRIGRFSCMPLEKEEVELIDRK